MAYDNANALLKRERVHLTTAGASAVTGKFTSFATVKLQRMQANAITAGTSSGAGNKVDLYIGTASAATVTLGSSTADTVVGPVDLTALAVVAPGTVISFKNGTDATGVTGICLEYTEQDA